MSGVAGRVSFSTVSGVAGRVSLAQWVTLKSRAAGCNRRAHRECTTQPFISVTLICIVQLHVTFLNMFSQEEMAEHLAAINAVHDAESGDWILRGSHRGQLYNLHLDHQHGDAGAATD